MRLFTVGRNQGIAILSGLFVLLGIGALVGWLYLQVVKPGQRSTYFIFMEEVSGIRPGTEVRVNGFPVGQVSGIDPDLDIEGIEFRVTIVVDKIWPIPVDSTITITRDGILSTPILQLTPGQTETPLMEGGRILTIPAPPTITDQVSDLIENQVGPSLKAFMATAEVLQGQLEENVPAMVDDARYIMTTGSRAVAALEGEVEKLAIGLGDAGDLLSRISEDQNVEQVESFITNLEETSRNLQTASIELKAVLEAANSFVESGERLISSNEAPINNSIQDTELAMQSFATNIEAVMRNLERASQEIAALAGKLNENPSAILSGQGSRKDPLK
jgi:virulence factor Mce-like protein